MPKQPNPPPRPGAVIKERVIPQGMTVREAAKRLGVGRPALSNLLHGHSALSPDMAVRLEKAFGADREKLLELQAACDRYDLDGNERTIPVSAYAPPFLPDPIKARNIAEWATDDIGARSLLPVLLRKLVHSTGRDLRRVDFPGYDNAERKGWDGSIEAGAATPWIPRGTSRWEFGVSRNPRSKANNDYTTGIGSASSDETFIFVTPQNWPGKTDWANGKQADARWGDVRAYDASDLEQWLEHAIPAQIWLAERLGRPTDGFETLDRFWKRWAEASDPPLTPAIFQPAIAGHRDMIGNWLAKDCERPLVVTADSSDEAIAFLSRMFRPDEMVAGNEDLAVVFHSAPILRKLASSETPFIPVVHTEEAEAELSPIIYRRRHCIVVRLRNTVDSKPDIDLRQLNRDVFDKALEDMGVDGDRDRLARESGCSPTVLRRRLSRIPAIRTPAWATDSETARDLIPMALIGAWHIDSGADARILSTLAGKPSEEIERLIVRLRDYDDSPVWSVARYRGIVSKRDAIFAISNRIIEKDLTEFFQLAEHVLAEEDPALELPETRRWAAKIYGKVRDHSNALREGVRETLIMLSVHGNDLFRRRLGIDIEARVADLVRTLLTPLTIEKLLSHDGELPYYAEAAPDVFLNIIEEDLRRPQPAVFGLLTPVKNSPFSRLPRSGLLWALECLAWRNLGRVSPILARLSSIEIHDNYMNKPIASLRAIYCFWLPQTVAPLGDRIRSLEVLVKEFPDIGWNICMAQLGSGPQMSTFNYRPRWRNDAPVTGYLPVTEQDRRAFVRKSLDLALDWPTHDHKTLGDLVEWIAELPDEDRARVWSLIDAWADSYPDDRDKADLRKRIRQCARRGQQFGLTAEMTARARMTYERLEPNDPVSRYAWLFAESAWLYANSRAEISAGEDEDESLDHDKRMERVYRRRAEAIGEIWEKCGFSGVVEISSRSGSAYAVGHALASSIPDTRIRVDFLRQCLFDADGGKREMEACMRGFLRAIDDDDTRKAIMLAAGKRVATDRIIRLLQCAPFGRRTWRLLDPYPQDVRDWYWREVTPELARYDEPEINELVDRLIGVDRPMPAFHAAKFNWSHVETSRLKRLLFSVIAAKPDPIVSHGIGGHEVSEALNSLDGRVGVSAWEMAELEFAFLRSLDDSEHGIPNLERHVAEAPIFFVRTLALAFKRRDGREDPSDLRIEDQERRAALAPSAFDLLNRIGRIPGSGSDGKIDPGALTSWVIEVRRLCAEYGRAENGDWYVGQLLSKAPAGEDGSWPCPPVCETMQKIVSPEICEGFIAGARDARGAYFRDPDEGGRQERELANRYRKYAELRAIDYPYVSAILERIADSYTREAVLQDDNTEIDRRLLR